MSYLQQYGNNSNFGSSSGSKRRRRSLSSSSSSPPARRHSSYKSQDHQLQPNRCLGVFGLECFTKEEKLREVFAKFGPIEYIKMVNFYQTQISRGFCFVYFENISDARRAKDSCNGMRIDGRRIRVDFSTRKRAHSPTPGVYRGQPICLWNGGNQERVLWSPNKKYNTTEPNRSIDRVNEKFEKI